MRNLSDIGKILAGIQVPEDGKEQLESFLKELQYPFVDETENSVYRSFMRS